VGRDASPVAAAKLLLLKLVTVADALCGLQPLCARKQAGHASEQHFWAFKKQQRLPCVHVCSVRGIAEWVWCCAAWH
jgi:hypothetical protein